MTDSQPARGSHRAPCNDCHGAGALWSYVRQEWAHECGTCDGTGIQTFPPIGEAMAGLRDEFGHMFDGVKLEHEEESVAGGGGEVVTGWEMSESQLAAVCQAFSCARIGPDAWRDNGDEWRQNYMHHMRAALVAALQVKP